MVSLKSSRYRIEGEYGCVDVLLRDAELAFDPFDPGPLSSRDLNDHIADYIAATVEEIPVSLPLQVEFVVPAHQAAIAENFKSSFQHHFAFLVETTRKEFLQFLWRGFFFLLVGFVVLGFCMWAARHLPFFGPRRYLVMLRSAIMVVGWVSIWKPVDALLFGWYSLYVRMRLMKRIQSANVKIRYSDSVQRVPLSSGMTASAET